MIDESGFIGSIFLIYIRILCNLNLDIAVGAPGNEPENSGAVYIYLGSSAGIRTQYVQVGNQFQVNSGEILIEVYFSEDNGIDSN